MIEQGLIAKLNSSPAVQAITANGGWYEQLPTDAPMPNWSYMIVFANPVYGLQALSGLVSSMFQFDFYSENDNGVGTVNLGKAFKSVLDGFSGTLTDPDSTGVNSAFWVGEHDYPLDPARRTWRRMAEYRVLYWM